MPDITKRTLITLDDTIWYTLRSLTVLIRDATREHGLRSLQEEDVLSAIVKRAILDNYNEIFDKTAERTIARAKSKGVLGSVRAKTTEPLGGTSNDNQ